MLKYAEQIIFASIENKYRDCNENDAKEIVARTTRNLASATHDACLAKLEPVNSSHVDITNQAVVLTIIERFWSKPPYLAQPLTTINSCLCGTPGYVVSRTTDDVNDFGGVVPTHRFEAPARLDEIERLCTIFLPQLIDGPGALQMDFLAYVYGAVIRIHPFEDGNGRTARFFIFYALTCWHRPLILIPKVRNDPVWKEAIDRAIKDDIKPLSIELNRRLGVFP